MNKALVIVLSIIALGFCWLLNQPNYARDPKFANDWQTYIDINNHGIINRLTAEQLKMVSDFDRQCGVKGEKLSQVDLSFIHNYPWLSPHHLSVNDKVFLVTMAKKTADDLQHLGAIGR